MFPRGAWEQVKQVNSPSPGSGTKPFFSFPRSAWERIDPGAPRRNATSRCRAPLFLCSHAEHGNKHNEYNAQYKSTLPRCRDREQPRCAGIVTRAGIAPVLGRVHVSAPNWIIMQVIQLLPHHFLSQDRLGMRALLPHLMLSVSFVRFFIEGKLLKPVVRARDKMDMIFHDYIPV